METRLSLMDYMILSILILAAAFFVDMVRSPAPAHAQAGSSGGVAAAITADGETAIIVKPDSYIFLDREGLTKNARYKW